MFFLIFNIYIYICIFSDFSYAATFFSTRGIDLPLFERILKTYGKPITKLRSNGQALKKGGYWLENCGMYVSKSHNLGACRRRQTFE